jgi:hypothetical protein
MARRLLLALLLAGCGTPPDGAAGDAGAADAAIPGDLAAPPRDLAAPGDLVPAPPRTLLFTLDAGAFPPSPSHPSALVYLPRGFDPKPPLAVIVYLHGWYNCVGNIINDAGAPCSDGGVARQAYSLAAQLEASDRNAILLCPELAFDQGTSNPGNLANPNAFRALLTEVLADLAPAIGPHTPADVGEVVVASHSGGYLAAAGIVGKGGVPVAELYLLDSLYGSTTDFDNWVKQDLASLAGPSPLRRFADVYTTGGGTLANSQAMADRAAGWVPPDAGTLVDDRATSTWMPDQYRHGLLFKHSGLTHDGVPRYYFEQLVSTSGLPTRP